MRFKLDENFGTRTQRLFVEAGHDVHTVRHELLQGASDEQLYRVCCAEKRCLVTFDLDFANPLRFPPGKSGGIVVIRVPRNPSLTLLEDLVEQTLTMVAQTAVSGQLWVVEPGHVRIYDTENVE